MPHQTFLVALTVKAIAITVAYGYSHATSRDQNITETKKTPINIV